MICAYARTARRLFASIARTCCNRVGAEVRWLELGACKALTCGSVAKKRGRAELVRKGRGADAKPVAHHSVKHYAQRPAGVDRLDAGKWGMEKGLIFSDSHRKGISLIGQIQLLPPPDGPYSAPSPWNFGVVRVIAAGVVGALGLTTIGLLATHKPVRYRRRKRGPYTRPAHSPHARRWLRESCPQPLC